MEIWEYHWNILYLILYYFKLLQRCREQNCNWSNTVFSYEQPPQCLQHVLSKCRWHNWEHKAKTICWQIKDSTNSAAGIDTITGSSYAGLDLAGFLSSRCSIVLMQQYHFQSPWKSDTSFSHSTVLWTNKHWWMQDSIVQIEDLRVLTSEFTFSNWYKNYL